MRIREPSIRDTGEGWLNEKFLHENPLGFTFETNNLDEIILRYREAGAKIGSRVKIEPGVTLRCERICLSDDVHIQKDAYIECRELNAGEGTSIGQSCDLVADFIELGAYNRICHRVKVDVSGGKSYASQLVTGQDCLVCEDAFINVCRPVKLSDHVCLSPRAMIFTHSFWQSVLEGHSPRFEAVVLDKDSWIGAAAQVLPGVRVGEGATVLSNSLAVQSVDPRTVVGGVPAVVMKAASRHMLEPNKGRVLAMLLEHLTLRLEYTGHLLHLEKVTEATLLRLKHSENAEQKEILLTTGWNSDLADYVGRSEVRIVIVGFGLEQVSTSLATWVDLARASVRGFEDDLTHEVREAVRRLGICLTRKPKP